MSVQPPRERPPQETDGLERLGPYFLLEQQASGELCSVHLAQAQDDAVETPTVIIKRLHRRHMLDAERRFALQKEAELGARIRSAHVVRTLSWDDTPEPYVVMEPLHGANLSVLLSRVAQPLDLAATRHVVPLIVEALQGLSDLHGSHPEPGAHFVHQAPCARHIMACTDGHARIIDLTLAMDTTQPRSPLCDARLLPAEMAPEQALAPSHLDPRCDLFIVGVALWEALTGKRLFAADTPQQTLDRMLRSAIVSPSQAGATSGRTFDRVCMRALSRPRSERYASAAEFAADLREEAIRANLYAEASEVGDWVRDALDAAAPARTRGAARPGHATIQGLGEPNFALSEIARGLRDSQLDEPTTRVSRPRGRREQRSNAAAPVLLAPSAPPPERAREFPLSLASRATGQIVVRKPTRGFAIPRHQIAFAMFCLAAAMSLALMALFSRDLVRVVPPALSSWFESARALTEVALAGTEQRDVAAPSSPQPTAPDGLAAGSQPSEATTPAAVASAQGREAVVAEARERAAPERSAQPQAELPGSARPHASVAPTLDAPKVAQRPTSIAPPALPPAQPAPAQTRAVGAAKAQTAVAKTLPRASTKSLPKSAKRTVKASARSPAKPGLASPPPPREGPSEVPLPLLESGTVRATQFGGSAAGAGAAAPATEPPALPAATPETQTSEGLPINPY